MALFLRTPLDVVRKTLEEFVKDDCPQMAAALAYYAPSKGAVRIHREIVRDSPSPTS